MSDFLGPIAIPDPPVIGAFPIKIDYQSGMDVDIPIVTHSFDQPGLKTEQRFVLGDGARRFRVQRNHLSCNEYDLLKSHWIQAQGMYAQFPYTYTGNFKVPSETLTVRYENPSISFTHLVGFLTQGPGVSLLEVPSATPSYTSAATLTRFPDATFTAALTQQTQHLIPLITIQPRTVPGSSPISPMYLSNQRFTLDGTLYLPRLIDWSGISQSIGEASDSARFNFGNADGVWIQLINQVNLERALVDFALYHVESQYIVRLWGGYALPWTFDADGHFQLGASDGAYELSLGYPVRTCTRTCWKVYKGRFCPSVSSLPDCPKSFDACVERGVPKSFGGVVAGPTGVRIKDNSTGTWGFGRSTITSVSIIEDTIYQRPVQEVYTDVPMEVNCDVAAGRDESEFYSALGIVGEGPISSYSTDLIRQRLDGQPPHDLFVGGGWRGILGTDPAGVSDFFALDQAPWNVVPAGATYAAGLAFAEIRRTDATGVQLSKVSDRQMTVTVSGGIGGWVWSAPGVRTWQPKLANFVWVAVNVYLRALGLRADEPRASAVSTAAMEAIFDVNQAIASAAIADTVVDKLIGPGTERQFPFRGVLKERKALKDWLQEIMNCGLGYFTFVNRKLWIGIRINSSVLAGNAYNRNSILFKSLQISPHQPKFNWLVGQFGDEEFNFDLNNVTIYDIDHGEYIGSQGNPEYHSNTMSFVGVSNKSQCARLVTTRLREELGGANLTEYLQARGMKFRTTVLGLRTMAGDIISIDHTWLPGGRAEGRVQKWTLNPDFSIDIEASPSADSMYDYDVGPKPEDVPAAPELPEVLESPSGLAWMPNHVAPFAGDPLYPDPDERTFDLWQEYDITREGIWSPAIWIGGEMVVNRFVQAVQPRLVGIELASGGALAGPMVVYVAVTQHDPSGLYTVPSNLSAVWIPVGTIGQALTIQIAAAPTGPWTGWDLYVGNDRRRLARQMTTESALPSAFTFLGPISQMTMELPEAAARKVRIAAKHVWHAGIAGVLVSGVTAPNQIQSDEFIGSTDNWVGRVVSALADASDGSAPLWNFTVSAFNGTSGTLTVTPNCVQALPEDSVQVGDVLVVRSIATSAGAGFVEDTMWNNFVALNEFSSPGLAVGAEVGRLARILRGKGAGQIRRITSNTAIRLNIEPDWDTIPDATSIIIVEAVDYDTFSETSDIDAPRAGKPFELRLKVDNLANEVALVAGFLVDNQGRLSDEEVAVFREIYIFGETPGVRVVGPGPGPGSGGSWPALATDTTLRGDTSANDVTIQLPTLESYRGRELYIVNNNGPHDLIVNCVDGEFYFDANSSITLGVHETVRVTAG